VRLIKSAVFAPIGARASRSSGIFSNSTMCSFAANGIGMRVCSSFRSRRQISLFRWSARSASAFTNFDVFEFSVRAPRRLHRLDALAQDIAIGRAGD
jgi:hypothetical protein